MFEQEADQPRQLTDVVSIALIGINILVYVAMVVKGVPALNPGPQDILKWGGDFAPMTLHGQWWRLFTSCFVHFGIIHIGMNMFILLQIGPFVERLYGSARFLFLYLAAGVAGALVSLYVHPIAVGAGASGAIFGLYGGLLAFLLIERSVVDPAAAKPLIKSAVIFLGYNLVYGLARPETDLSAHIGGLLGGFLIGCCLVPHREGGPWRAPFAAAALGVIVVLGLGLSALVHAASGNKEESQIYSQLLSGDSVALGVGGKLIYTGKATKEEAGKVAEVLNAAGFRSKTGVVAFFDKGAQGATLSIEVGKTEEQLEKIFPITAKKAKEHPEALTPEEVSTMTPWNDPETAKDFTVLGVRVRSALNGVPLRVALMTTDGKVQRTLPIDWNMKVLAGDDMVWFAGAATAQQAQALGEALQEKGFLHARRSIILLKKGDQGTEITLLLRHNPAEKADTPAAQQLVRALQMVMRSVAGTVGGTPITLHLADANMVVYQTVEVR